METSAVQRADLNAIVDKVEVVVWMVMGEATIEGGMHWAPSTRTIGAAVKFIRSSGDDYKGNPIVEGVVARIKATRGEPKDKVDFKKLDPAVVMGKVDEVVPILEAEGEHGTQTKRFIYRLAETMVGASGSGFMGTGERINEAEAKFLADLKAHLRS